MRNVQPFQPLYYDALKQVNELKEFIASECLKWEAYPLPCSLHRIYAPSQEVAESIRVGQDIWHFVNVAIKNPKKYLQD